jgi:hypothetical protein
MLLGGADISVTGHLGDAQEDPILLTSKRGESSNPLCETNQILLACKALQRSDIPTLIELTNKSKSKINQPQVVCFLNS